MLKLAFGVIGPTSYAQDQIPKNLSDLNSLEDYLGASISLELDPLGFTQESC